MVVFDVRFNFFHDGLFKISCIRLPDGLMEVHDVTHHLLIKHNEISHSFLKFQMEIMKEVCLHLSIESALGGHLVHVTIAVEILL